MANSVDLNQMSSSEAIRSRAILSARQNKWFSKVRGAQIPTVYMDWYRRFMIFFNITKDSFPLRELI